MYQVFVDRFNRSSKAASSGLKTWTELPKPGHEVPESGVWSHELDFWGGDLEGIRQKLDYIQSFRTDVWYLTPIFSAMTNRRYDTRDYFHIDPKLGTSADFEALLKDVHRRRMKLILDGVSNHMGATSPMFQAAKADPSSKYRKWFCLTKTARQSTGLKSRTYQRSIWKISGDPWKREPMRWDLVEKPNEEREWIEGLASIRQRVRGLRYGDFRILRTRKVLAFTRLTNHLRESAVVIVNPTAQNVRESFQFGMK